MQKTKIEWTDYVWNPIKGLCPHGCWYCYAKKIYERFGWGTEMKIAEEYPNMIIMPLYDRKKEVIFRKVFVCSTFELFHPLVKKEWRDWIFDVIEYNSNLTFQILTKFPQNIDRPMPDNVWLGTSITRQKEMWRLGKLEEAKSKIKFISFEPLLSPINLKATFDRAYEGINWIIIGRLTGYGKRYDPHEDWIREFIEIIPLRIKIFLKNNLRDIWKAKLIQEFPDV